MKNENFPFEITQDQFFAGKLTIAQPKNGFRAGLDSLLLAASISVPRGAKVLELGSGVGTASLALSYRINVDLTGIEIEQNLVELANYNANFNGLSEFAKFIHGDATNHKTINQRGFDCVMLNPPFYNTEAGQSSPIAQKATATHTSDEILSLWVNTAIICLKPAGLFALIAPPNRLSIILQAIGDKLGAIEIVPVQSKPNSPALRIIVQGKKGRKTPLKLLPAFITQHENGEMTAKMKAIAENSADLNGV